MSTEADFKKLVEIAAAVHVSFEQPHIGNLDVIACEPVRHMKRCLRTSGLCKPRLSQVPSANSAMHGGIAVEPFNRTI